MRVPRFTYGIAVLVLSGLLCSAQAQTDEIQVYNGELAKTGQFTLTLHNNYTFKGRTVPDFAGGIVPDHALNGVPEWAYGVNDWLEVGAYLPVYTLTRDGTLKFDSAKLRALLAVPDAEDRSFFYGVNFELSYNEPQWERRRFSAEIRPIIGGRIGPVDIILNPILDTSFDGVGRLDFAPAARLAYNFSSRWAVALEHYADFGELRDLAPPAMQQHTLFAVLDYTGAPANIEVGLGHGTTSASDKLVGKLMLEWDLN